MNDFSMVCRVLGTLFYRHPQDPLLAPLMALISQGKLTEHWPLEQDELLRRLQDSCDPAALAADYTRLFGAKGLAGSDPSVTDAAGDVIAPDAAGTDGVGADHRDKPGSVRAEVALVSPLRSSWLPEDAAEVAAFLQQLGMPRGDGPADHFGALLLAGSWLEDRARLDETAAQRRLFDGYLLPWSDRFLGKVEACATGGFYRTLAIISREALPALREELDETPQ